MSEGESGDEAATGATAKSKLRVPESSLSALTTSILEDSLYNIIHTLVLDVHRSEKLLRMQSAAVLASTTAEAQASSSSSTTNAPSTKNTSLPAPPPSIRLDTPGATYDAGRITLRGNPLKTTPELLCPACKLPRLLYPLSGTGAQTPDLRRQYCTRHPFVSRAGHDVYGNPFPVDAAKTKKERELLRKAEKESTPGSQGTGEGGNANRNSTPNDDSGSAAGAGVGVGAKLLAPTGKPASYVPWHTCPSCKRSLLITRFAQHLEKCLGISGRQSSRAAMAKINSSQSQSQSQAQNTPLGSRVGTPAPGGGRGSGRNERDDEVADGGDAAGGTGSGTGTGTGTGLKIKLKKKGAGAGTAGSGYVKKPSSLRENGTPKTKAPGKRLPKPGGENGGEGKREREREREKDAEGEQVNGEASQPQRKKIKLLPQQSTVSVGESVDGEEGEENGVVGSPASGNGD